ncbi:MAG TPA: Hsp20/alpha crystallin family protein [Candidatus Paceibacterota bacterium]|nr:Hsp20/alpha crystallin family protein [Verrucomicrobiota bacterium]HOX03703.1 Hsp20/alpha crystallin family protein [Verrucomicrobiota bacterium]HRZ46404.1 Hsp20/alpha crystallin family protein [Candidatus Paceibacterota bacterium]
MATCKAKGSLAFEGRPVSRPGPETASGAYWIPNTDVYITERGLCIKIELAGIHREELELTAEGSRLVVCGRRPDGSRPHKCKFRVMEINYGAFERIIDIPEGYDLTQARALYQNGFLRIEVPAAAEPIPRRITVPILDRTD